MPSRSLLTRTHELKAQNVAKQIANLGFSLLTRTHELKAQTKDLIFTLCNSLLTRTHELKEPVCNPLILNVLHLSFREPVTFILYD